RRHTLTCWAGTAMMTIIAGLVYASQVLAHDQSVDDSRIQLRSVADLQAKRDAIVQYIWATSWADVLTRQPTATHDNYTPVMGDALPAAGTLSNLDRIEKVVITMNATAAHPDTVGRLVTHTSTAYLFHPRASNGRVVIIHQGHNCALDDRDGHFNLD